MLAPSQHNAQPWSFRVEGSQLQLRALDPSNREHVMACGFALFCLRLAARAVGLGLAVTPGSDPLALIRRSEPDRDFDWEAEFSVLPYLRYDHRPFRNEAVPEGAVRELSGRLAGGFPRGFESYAGPVALRLIEDPAVRQRLAGKIEEATRARWSDAGFRRQVAAGCEGVPAAALGYPGWLGWLAPRLLPVLSPANRVSRDEARRAREGPLLAVLGCHRDLPPDWLAAGECLACLVSTARWQELSSWVFSDAIASGRNQVAEQTGLEHPVAVLRLGRGGHLAPTPRRWAALT